MTSIISDIVNERQHSTIYVYKAVIPLAAKPEIRTKRNRGAHARDFKGIDEPTNVVMEQIPS